MGFVNFLIEQSGNPSGFVGDLLLTTMDLAHGKVIEKALEPIRNTDSLHVLDIGFGSGYALKFMNRRFRSSHLDGIDISETCVKKAKRMNRKALNGNTFSFKVGDVGNLSYDDDSMDIVTAFQTHYFWPDIHRACREIRRVLKPRGLFILCGDLYKMEYHLKAYQRMDEYPALLEGEGFTDIQVYGHNGFMIAYARKGVKGS